MFDGGVKETLCTRCAHRDVCAHKQDYMTLSVGSLLVASTTKTGRKPTVPEKQFSETARKIHPLL